MKSATRILVTGGLAAMLLWGATGARGAVVDWSLVADTFGAVPNSSGPFDNFSGVLSGPPGNTEASASLIILSDAPGTEMADGAALATVDPLFFGNSSVGARSKVSTGGVVSTVVEPDCLCMSDTSIAALGATLSNPPAGAPPSI